MAEEGGGVAFTLYSYYRFALQAGWGCYGNGEGSLQWELSGVPVGWGPPNTVA